MFFQKIPGSLRFLRGDFVFKKGLLLCLLIFSSVLTAQPKAEVIESKKSFGSVKRGEKIELRYEIKNTGDAPLILFEAEVSCSCTSVEFSKEPLPPGKTTVVVVVFDTKSVWGRQDRQVYIKCNAAKGEIALRYKGQVSKD